MLSETYEDFITASRPKERQTDRQPFHVPSR